MLTRQRLTSIGKNAAKRDQFKRKIRVAVETGRQTLDNVHPHPQLFLELAMQGILVRLARFDLSPGKFPFQSEIFPCRPPGDQQPFPPLDQPANNPSDMKQRQNMIR